MEVTAPPWVPRRRLHRVRVGSLPRDEYWLAPRLNIYTGRFQRPDEHVPRHIIRFEGGMGPRIIFPTPANPWLQHQYPLDTEPWRLPVPLPPDLKTFRQDPVSVESASESTPPPPRHHWTDSALGWAAGTVLLAVFVLIVRAAEKCLDRKLFKIRRRPSEEWPTPNVLATSHQHPTGPEAGPPSHPESFSQTIDLPPPYSECATGPKPSVQSEDPPPPYSDCYVSFINPKDGIPTARIMRRRDGNASGSNIGQDNDSSNVASQVNQSDTSNGNDNIDTNTHEMQNGDDALVDIGGNSSNDGQNESDNAKAGTENVGSNNTNDESNGSTSQDCVIIVNGNGTVLQV